MCDHCGCRSYPPIAELTAEHEQILELAWRLAESASAAVPGDLRARLLALLDVHSAKEEIGLYPQLAETGDLPDGQRARLEDEHAALGNLLLAGPFDRRAFYALAAHIEEEEMELFPSAMFAFDEEEWEAIADAHRAAGTPTAAPA